MEVWIPFLRAIGNSKLMKTLTDPKFGTLGELENLGTHLCCLSYTYLFRGDW